MTLAVHDSRCLSASSVVVIAIVGGSWSWTHCSSSFLFLRTYHRVSRTGSSREIPDVRHRLVSFHRGLGRFVCQYQGKTLCATTSALGATRAAAKAAGVPEKSLRLPAKAARVSAGSGGVNGVRISSRHAPARGRSGEKPQVRHRYVSYHRGLGRFVCQYQGKTLCVAKSALGLGAARVAAKAAGVPVRSLRLAAKPALVSSGSARGNRVWLSSRHAPARGSR